MSAHILFYKNNKVLNMSLSVIMSAIGVVTSPGKFVKYTPTVSEVQCVSSFCGRILDTILL